MASTPLPSLGSLPSPSYKPHICSLLPRPSLPPRGAGLMQARAWPPSVTPAPLALGQFHTVTLLRSLTQGSLIVGSLAPVNGTSQVRPSPVPLSLAPPHLRSASPFLPYPCPGQVPGSGPE